MHVRTPHMSLNIWNLKKKKKWNVTAEHGKVTFGKQTIRQELSLFIQRLTIFKCSRTKRSKEEKNKGKAKLKLSVCT